MTEERLKELLTYDPETGEFRWRVATSPRVRVGDIAGCNHCQGYRAIKIDGAQYYAHRIAFVFMTGKFPALDVEHIDRDPGNNRWSNLRDFGEIARAS